MQLPDRTTEDFANKQNINDIGNCSKKEKYPETPGRLIVVQKLSSNERKSFASRSCFTEKHLISKETKQILDTPSGKSDEKEANIPLRISTNTPTEIGLTGPVRESIGSINSVSETIHEKTQSKDSKPKENNSLVVENQETNPMAPIEKEPLPECMQYVRDNNETISGSGYCKGYSQ